MIPVHGTGGRSPRAALAVPAWFALLLLVAWCLHRAGTWLPAPPADPAHVGDWVGTAGADAAAASILRIGALAGTVYLATLSAVSVVLELARVHRGSVVGRVLTRAPGGRTVGALAARALGAGIVLAVGTTVATGPATAEPTSAVMASLDGEAHTEPDGTATMEGLSPLTPIDPDSPTTEPAGDTPNPGGADPARDEIDPAADEAGASETWIVEPGDHLWGVATSVLGDAWGRTPADRETVGYWRELLLANGATLADPDLVFPGQVLRLPETPPSATDA